MDVMSQKFQVIRTFHSYVTDSMPGFVDYDFSVL